MKTYHKSSLLLVRFLAFAILLLAPAMGRAAVTTNFYDSFSGTTFNPNTNYTLSLKNGATGYASNNNALFVVNTNAGYSGNSAVRTTGTNSLRLQVGQTAQVEMFFNSPANYGVSGFGIFDNSRPTLREYEQTNYLEIARANNNGNSIWRIQARSNAVDLTSLTLTNAYVAEHLVSVLSIHRDSTSVFTFSLGDSNGVLIASGSMAYGFTGDPFLFLDNTSTSSTRFDNLLITSVPEPSVAWGLVLGAVAFGGLRRAFARKR